VFLAGAAAVIAGAISDVNGTALLAFGVMAAGVPVAFLWRRVDSRPRPSPR
jgi:hypothetical protein